MAILLAAALAVPALAMPAAGFADSDTAYTAITDLKVNALVEPLAVDLLPEFSWNMQSNVIGQAQTAYRIEVYSDAGQASLVWNSGDVASSESVGVMYGGPALAPETDYWWVVTVVDAFGARVSSEPARFATGLMDSLDRSVWDGAQFIGSADVVLGAAHMKNFALETKFSIVEGDNFSLVFAADDFRFTDPALNPFNTPGGENFMRIEIDTSEITAESNPGAVFRIYRVGYHETDTMNGDPNKSPLKWGRLPVEGEGAVTFENKNQEHSISVQVSYSAATIRFDGVNLPTAAYAGQVATTKEAIGTPTADGSQLRRPVAANNNNIGPNYAVRAEETGNLTFNTGGNHNTYPHLNSIGFQVNGVGDKVVVSSTTVAEVVGTRRVLFGNDAGATQQIFVGLAGVEVADDGTVTVTGVEENAGVAQYADPSYGSMKYLRTEFDAEQDKEIAGAKLYATAFGGYEFFINGARVGEDWFNPGLTQFREYLNYSAYDVTDLVREGGPNALSAVVGVGFWLGYMANTQFNTWGDDAGLMAKLVVTYTDGSEQTIVTDPASWRVSSQGPVVFSDIFDGEAYDASQEANVDGFKLAGYEEPEGVWTDPAVVTSKHPATGDYTFDNVKIEARRDQPVQQAETLTATRVLNTHTATTYTYDMGTTLTGVPSVTIPAGQLKEGDVVAFRFGEFIYPGNEDSVDFYGDVIEWHRDVYGNNDYAYADLYGPEGGFRPNAAGKLLHDTYRGAVSSDLYVASKADETRDVVIEPHFTFRSYRFIQISIPSLTAPLPVENVKGLVLSSIAIPENRYEATTADDNLTASLTKQFFDNSQRSQLGNFFSIPTDCPQRNERQGWTGDLQAYSRTATYHSLDTQNFLRQWLESVRADQTVGGGIGTTSPAYSFSKPSGNDTSIVWGGALVQAPWQLYMQYNDLEVVKESYDSMKLYMGSKPAPAEYPGLTTVNSLSDHIGLDRYTASGNGSNILQNALWIYLTAAVAEMAEALGDSEYAAELNARYDVAVDSFNRAFVEPETGMMLSRSITDGALAEITENGVTNCYIDSQSSYAYPLFFGIMSDTMTVTEGPNAGMTYAEFAAARLAELIADPSKTGGGRGPTANSTFALGAGGPYTASGKPYTITTGFAATPSLLPALTSTGSNEAAYELFTNTDYATWLYPVSMGATSMWELWNSYERALMWNGDSAMNSFNHFALGAAGAWMYEYQMGITSGDGPGYQDFVLQPTPGGNYTSLLGSYKTNYGVIESAWTAKGNGAADENGTAAAANELLTYSATVPANTSATLYLPVAAVGSFAGAPGVSFIGMTTRNGSPAAEFSLLSGGYVFTVDGDGDSVSAVLAEGYEQGPTVGVTAAEKTAFGDDVEYVFSAQLMSNVNLVEIGFVADAALLGVEGASVTGLGGFSLFEGIEWGDVVDGKVSGKFIVGVIDKGVTKSGDSDIASFKFEGLKLGDAELEITSVTGFGIDLVDGVAQSCPRAFVADPASAVTKIFSVYDINDDDRIDFADLSLAFYYYQSKAGDGNWGEAARADVDGNGIVNMVDLVAIYANIKE